MGRAFTLGYISENDLRLSVFILGSKPRRLRRLLRASAVGPDALLTKQAVVEGPGKMKQRHFLPTNIMLQGVVLIAILPAASVLAAEPVPPFIAKLPTGVAFTSSDPDLQRLHDAAQARLRENIVRFTPAMKVLVEGGGYGNAWIETQPMGGEMYAKRNPQVALNNQVIFMLAQRRDGRLPGMVIAGQTAIERGWDENPREGYVWMPEHHLVASFEMFQGYCFPEPAWRMYHWMGRDKRYLRRLDAALQAHDAYLWRTRDSNGDGLLETWCVWDTGEDGSTRLITRGAPSRWPFELPPGVEGTPDPTDPEVSRRYWFYGPPDKVRVPFASMDVMAYSYAGRATLAKIARELDTGKQAYWRRQAEEVRQRLIDKLWVPERHACFDLDRKGRRLPELIHNNLRCMWYGIFTQQMADAFIKHHLLNPAEFWTPVPLVSIAVNEPLYRNARGNNWSGQPQGLTYQRAIGALENYGHYAEVTLLGQKLLPVLIRNGCRFSQQLDPATGDPSGHRPDGYGPMALAALEYLSRMHGVHVDVEHGRVWWSAVGGEGHDFTYAQRWGHRRFELRCKDDTFRGLVGDRAVFACTVGGRVITDLDGHVLQVVGISPESEDLRLQAAGQMLDLHVAPNEVHRVSADGTELQSDVPFDYPHP